MAKLKDDPITKEDIAEYLQDSSDFAFEVLVLRKLTSLGFSCEHAGTYEDPVTKKTREFDIRAWRIIDLNEDTTFRFCMAVECKNLKENFPLVVHCMPRSEAEAYQHIVWSHTPSDHLSRRFEYGRQVSLDGDDAVYRVGEPVGKSCDQIGRRVSAGELIGTDGKIFEKISQSINSTYDILDGSHHAGDKELTVISFVIPVLVVPKDRIWAVTYDLSGNITDGPKLVPRVPYYIDKSWKIGGGGFLERSQYYYLSHLEIVDIESLEELIDTHTRNDRFSHKKLSGYLLKGDGT